VNQVKEIATNKKDKIVQLVKIKKSKNSGAKGIKIAFPNRFMQSYDYCLYIRIPDHATNCLKIPPQGLANHVYPKA
jgi:hypothetical protein